MPYISNGRSWLAWSTTGAYTCEPAQAVGSRLTSPEPLFSQEDLPWAHYRDEGIVFFRHHGLLGCLFPFLSLFWKSRGCFLADHFDCNNEAKIPPKEKALLESGPALGAAGVPAMEQLCFPCPLLQTQHQECWVPHHVVTHTHVFGELPDW